MKKDELDRDRDDCYLPIHRLVVDESHVLPAAETTTHLKVLCGYSPSFVWLLTGTPISKSMGDLKGGAWLLGHWSHGLKLSAHRNPKREVADLLKQVEEHGASLGDSTRLHTLRQALKDLRKEALELEVSIGIALQQNAHIWRQKHRMVHKDPFHDDDDGFEVDSLLTDSVS